MRLPPHQSGSREGRAGIRVTAALRRGQIGQTTSIVNEKDAPGTHADGSKRVVRVAGVIEVKPAFAAGPATAGCGVITGGREKLKGEVEPIAASDVVR